MEKEFEQFEKILEGKGYKMEISAKDDMGYIAANSPDGKIRVNINKKTKISKKELKNIPDWNLLGD